jgi:hypothetical protein
VANDVTHHGENRRVPLRQLAEVFYLLHDRELVGLLLRGGLNTNLVGIGKTLDSMGEGVFVHRAADHPHVWVARPLDSFAAPVCRFVSAENTHDGHAVGIHGVNNKNGHMALRDWGKRN